MDIPFADETCAVQIVSGIRENWYFDTCVWSRLKGVSDLKVQNDGIRQKSQTREFRGEMYDSAYGLLVPKIPY